jgi:hypothetical protein
MSSEIFINHKPFDRLRWRVFGNIDDILVEEREDDKVTELLPFKNHPSAKEPATLTDITSLELTIEELTAKQAFDRSEEEDRYHAPAPLRVEKDEGHPITVGDVVGSLHEYLNTHKRDIIQAINEIAGEEAVVEVVDADGNAFSGFEESQPLYFKCLYLECRLEDGQHTVSVDLFWEGDLGNTVDDFWRIRLARSKMDE